MLAAGCANRFPDDADRLLHVGSIAPMRHVASGFEVDVVFGATSLEVLFATRARRQSLDGVSVPVASATDLVVMKVLAGRPLDLEDAKGLLASGAVDRREVLDLLRQIEEALGRSDLEAAFEALGSLRDVR